MRFRLHGILVASVLLGDPLLAGASPRAMAVPIGRADLALGAAYDSESETARGETGACVEGDETLERDATGARYSIATLTRAGGRLVVGIHVSAPIRVEQLGNPRLTDAARRLERSDGDGFRDLCGDGYLASVTRGDQFLAEVEVQRKDVSRALARLTTGTWADPDAFRDALEALVKPVAVTARELPGGSRAAARPLSAEEVVTRALAFPATVTPENAKPYLAGFEPYSSSAFSGMVLPDPEDLDDREVAEKVFRQGRGLQRSAASRAADLRAVQVQRSEPEPAPPRRERVAATASEEAATGLASDTPAAIAPPAAPALGLESPPTVSQLRSQAALVYATPGELPVFATTRAPDGVHAERVRERAYWVPGAAAATPEVTRAIERARSEAPARGTTVVIVDVGAATVVMTDAAPAGGTFSVPAGERRAWIAGVVRPNSSQRAALAAAVEAEAHDK